MKTYGMEYVCGLYALCKGLSVAYKLINDCEPIVKSVLVRTNNNSNIFEFVKLIDNLHEVLSDNNDNRYNVLLITNEVFTGVVYETLQSKP